MSALLTVESPHVLYSASDIVSTFRYSSNEVDGHIIRPKEVQLNFKTDRKVPRTGLMLVGWGGNNGSTVTAGILANLHNIEWETKEGKKSPNYFGSLSQASTINIGLDSSTRIPVYLPLSSILPMVHPNELVLGGWDISSNNLADAMKRAKVLDYDLQRQLIPLMKGLIPLPSIFDEKFVAENQAERADNIIAGGKQEQLERIRSDIRDFKERNHLDKVIVLWTANTERFSDIIDGVHNSANSLLDAIRNGHPEISPSTIFAVASILEGCSYINGSPQNTFVPGVIELAMNKKVFIVGDDFKSGQTKMKSVLVDFLISAGIKPVSIVSYNHLGNNDGKNLSAPAQFRSKEISKSNVVDDMVASNKILYGPDEQPDHVVVIKYVPYVGDSKRAMDEYTSEIFLGGKNTIVLHNTCEDSLLASPLIIDLAILCELCERITVKRVEDPDSAYETFHPVLSILSYLMKAPVVPPGTPVVNALAAQRQCIVNIFRACVGLAPESFMNLEHNLQQVANALHGKKRMRSQTDDADEYFSDEIKKN